MVGSGFTRHTIIWETAVIYCILHDMSDSKPIQESDIIFPSAHRSIFSTLSELKRRNLSVKNRILSIIKDAAFVERVSLHFRLPLIANERCGSWYIRPDLKTGSAYFKSTDGHFGQWAFSLRRLNLQVLDVCGRERGYGLRNECLEFTGQATNV